MSLDIDKYGLMHSAPQGKMPKILGVPALIAEKIKGKLSDRRLLFSFSSSPHYQSALALIIYHRNHWISHWVYRFSYRNDLLWLVISLLEVYGNNLTVTDWYHFATVDCRSQTILEYSQIYKTSIFPITSLFDNQYNANIDIKLSFY